jgi:murein L,D-transpeptidase YcbB/YkuD
VKHSSRSVPAPRVQNPQFLVQVSSFHRSAPPETGDLSVTTIVESEISNGFYKLTQKLAQFIKSLPMSEQEFSETTAPNPILHPWDAGQAVAELQELLRAHGFKVRIDGDFGWLTEAAVKEYQRQHELKPDGIVGAATWHSLKSLVQAGVRLLRLHHSGADVHELQGLLQVSDGGYALKRDGTFGEKTRQAVLDFQQHHHLKPTGMVDPPTWAILRGKPCVPPPAQEPDWVIEQKKRLL